MTGRRLVHGLARRVLAAGLTAVCAMAVVTTSRTARPDLHFAASGSLHDTVLLQGESSAEIDVVQRLSPGSVERSDDRANTFSAEVADVHRESGPLLDQDLLPELTLVALDGSGAPLGDPVGPAERVEVRHPDPCALDEGCVRRYRLELQRPGPASRQLRVEVRLTTETEQAEDSPGGVAVDHVLTSPAVAAAAGHPSIADRELDRPEPPPVHHPPAEVPPGPADLVLHLPEDLPDPGRDLYLTLQLTTPGIDADVVVDVDTDPGGTLRFRPLDHEGTLDAPTGQATEVDFFRDPAARSPETRDFRVGFGFAGGFPDDVAGTISFHAPDGVLVLRGAAGAPADDNPAMRREERGIELVTVRTSGTVELTPGRPSATLRRALRLSSPTAEIGDRIGVPVGLRTVLRTPDARVRVGFETTGLVRTLTGDAPSQGAGDLVAGAVTDGELGPPLVATFELLGDEPATVDWTLEVVLDPFRTRVPPDVSGRLVPATTG